MNNTLKNIQKGCYRVIRIMCLITLSLVFMVTTISLTGCAKKKEAVSASEFKSTLGSGFEYTDLTSQYKSSDPSVVEVIDAKDKDGLELQYWRLKDDISASVNFHYKRHRIENQCPSNNTWEKERNEDMSAEGANQTVFYKLSKVDDTVIYTTVTLNNKSAVEKLFEKLGY